MKIIIAALASLFAAHVWAGAGDLRLKPCEDPKLTPAKCGTYTVWENRVAKSGRTIDLNVVVLQATGSDRKPDPVVGLAGGPGEAAASAAQHYASHSARATRDIVLVDARGTGRSNGLHCVIPDDSPLQEFLPTLNLSIMQACRPQLEQRADLRYYLTPYAMDDLDDLRAALGYDKINLDAGSYGTRAALVYIRQHGEHVRSATLWASTALTHPMPLYFATDSEGALRNVFRDCYAEPACKAAFPALEADYKRTVDRIESGPVRVTVKDPRNGKATQVDLNADDFAEALRGMVYLPESMRSIPLLLHKAASGDYTAFADFQIKRNIQLNSEIADGLYFSITCTEDIDRIDPQQLVANGRGTFLKDHRARPHMEGCKGWPRGKLPAGFGEEVKSDVPVLVLNGDNDPATPPATGRTAASRLSNARLIVVPHGGHAFQGLIGEDCVKEIAARFLETADQRSLDVTCLKDIEHQPFILAGAGELRLKPCEDPKLKQPAKCGTYTVWENRDAKSGRTIDLNVVVLQATGPNRKPDPLFILLGGPGEGAASAGPAWYMDDPARASRDLVFVDARGTGKSNGLYCPIPKDGPLQDFMPTLNLDFIRACRPELEKRADLRYYLTTYAMDDLDDVRAALGYDKINLDAGSYGTGAALVYIRQHGDHVRAATLWATTALTQPMPLLSASDSEGALRNVFRDCYAEAACKAAFPTLEADYKRAVVKIESGPVRLTVTDPRNKKPAEVTLDADAFAESLRAMLYKPETMRSVPLLLHKAAGGDYQAFAEFQLARNVDLNGAIADGLYFSITCTEDIDRADPQQVRANGRGTFLADHRARPHTEGCQGWPRGKLPAGFGEEVKSDVPVLIVNGDNDPATPPSAGRAALSRLSNGRMIVVPYGGHSSEGLIGEECVKTIAARFLDTADQRSLDVACLKDIRHQPFILE